MPFTEPQPCDEDVLAQLLGRIGLGERAAFRKIYAAASAKLFGVCLRMLRDRPEAEDALQEVFTRIWTRSRSYDPQKARAMTWMIAIARHHCIDRLRMRPRDHDATDAALSIADTAPTAEMRAVALGEAGRLRVCLGQLEDGRAHALRGAYLDGLSYEALAARHAVPLNTMRSWLRRGLQKLRECMSS